MQNDGWIHGPGGRILRLLVLTTAVVAGMGLDCDDEGSGPLDLSPAVGGFSGLVTVDGVPRAGATVTVRREGTLVMSASTGADGSYSVSGLEPLSYDLSVSALPGVECPTRTGAAVVANEETEVDFECQTLGSVTGLVTVNGIGVRAVVNLRDGETRIGALTSDDFGAYAFVDVPPGDKIVEVVPIDGWTCDTEVPVQVPTGGGTATADFPCTGQVVSGLVTLDGIGQSGIQVSVCLDLGGGEIACLSPRQVTDIDGLFDYTNGTPGEYVIFVEVPPAGATCESLNVSVPEGASVFVEIACTSD